MNNRISWIDYSKGIGIILVVYGHVLIGLNTANFNISESFFDNSIKLIYGFHMPLFFFLSGLFVERWANKNIGKGLSQKVQSILWPYLFWSVIQGSVSVILSSFTNSAMTWSQLGKNILINPISQFWFLYVLFICFLLFALLYRVTTVKIITLICAVLYVLSPFMEITLLRQLMFNFIFFALGSLVVHMGKDMPKLVEATKGYVIYSFIGFLIFNSLYFTISSNNFLSNIVQFFVAIAGINLIIGVSVRLSKFNALKFIKHLGVTSMVIYLMHILSGSGVRIILTKLFHVYDASVHLIIGTLLGIIIPIVCYKIIIGIGIERLILGEKGKKTFKNGNEIILKKAK